MSFIAIKEVCDVDPCWCPFYHISRSQFTKEDIEKFKKKHPDKRVIECPSKGPFGLCTRIPGNLGTMFRLKFFSQYAIEKKFSFFDYLEEVTS